MILQLRKHTINVLYFSICTCKYKNLLTVLSKNGRSWNRVLNGFSPRLMKCNASLQYDFVTHQWQRCKGVAAAGMVIFQCIALLLTAMLGRILRLGSKVKVLSQNTPLKGIGVNSASYNSLMPSTLTLCTVIYSIIGDHS